MVSLDDKSALLIYRVGPVYCCSPSLPVVNISIPSQLTHPPGTDSAHPGIFKFGSHIVSVSNLRFQFGVEQNDWHQPGKMVITKLGEKHIGFWVDEIIDVIKFPQAGWGKLPAQLPRGIFSRVLVRQEQIHLYAEFEKLQRLQGGGYLRGYIEKLEQRNMPQVAQTTTNKAASPADRVYSSTENKPVVMASPATTPQTTASWSRQNTEEKTKTITVPRATDNSTTAVKPTKDAHEARQKAGNIISTKQARQATLSSKKDTASPITPGKKTAATGKQAMTRSAAQATTTLTTPTEKPNRQAARQPEKQAGGLFALLAFLAVVIAAGYSAYYFLIDQPRQSRSLLLAEPVTPYASEPPLVYQPLEEAAATYSPVSSVTTSQPVEQAAADNKIAAATVTHKNEPEPMNHAPRQQDYHASIEQDQQGVTIILNGPQKPAREIQPDATSDTATVAKQDSAMASKQQTGTTSPPQTLPAEPEQARKIEIIHLVVKGDTLWDIAKRYVDDPFLYPQLARLSNIKNPHRIYPGNRVRIIRYLD